MRIIPDENRPRFPNRLEPVPLEYAGQWIAVTADRRCIVVAGKELIEIRKSPADAGYTETVLHSVAPSPFLGLKHCR